MFKSKESENHPSSSAVTSSSYNDGVSSSQATLKTAGISNSNGSSGSESTVSTSETSQTTTTSESLDDKSGSEIKDTDNVNDLETQRYYFQLGIKSFEEAKYVEAQYYLEKIKSGYIILADYIKFYTAK
ncbi:hypothetical protein LLG07_00545, partial [bacterium]|nr:hypothetical protein [bacterium]